MKITIDLDTTNAEDLAGLAALIAAIGGRPPEAAPAPVASRPAPPPPPSEQMIAEAAANRGAPPPPADEDPGTAADPTTLDSDGIPWDMRIHAGTKTQNKDGTWKKLRGVDEVLYGRIHGELQAQYAGKSAGPTGTTGSGTAPPPPPSATGSTAPPPPTNLPGETGNADGARTAETPPGATGAASATGAGRFPDFGSFVQAVNAIRTPAIPYLELNTFAQTVGVTGGFKDMKDRADLWETFYGMAGGQ